MASSGMGNQVKSSFGSGAVRTHLLGYAAGYVAFATGAQVASVPAILVSAARGKSLSCQPIHPGLQVAAQAALITGAAVVAGAVCPGAPESTQHICQSAVGVMAVGTMATATTRALAAIGKVAFEAAHSR
jgi:hypothetical protein